MSVPAIQREDLRGKNNTRVSNQHVLFPFIVQMLPKTLSKFTAAFMLRSSWHSQYNLIFSGVFILDMLHTDSLDTFCEKM